MSIPQAIPSVQTVPGLPVGGDNDPWPFAFPISNPQVTKPQRARFSGTPPQVASWYPGGTSAVQVGGIWLYQETVQSLKHAPWSQSPLDIARAAVTQGLNRIRELRQGMLTQHALMIAWGEFAYESGLIPKILRVSIPQKSVVHMPQAKLLTFLMGTLTGITHLKDLNEGPHPLAHDWAAIRGLGLGLAGPTTVASVARWLPATK